MKVVTAAEMQRIDRITIDERGIPGEVLMAHAGRAVADVLQRTYPDARSVAVFAGTGNNGGDGFVIAHFLKNRDVRTDIFIAGDALKVSPASAVYLNVCSRSGLAIHYLSGDRMPDLGGYDLVVDALAGTGFSGSPRGLLLSCIRAINTSGIKVLSVDVPSGLPSDGQAPEGDAVKADCTVTIGLPKISLVTHPGLGYAGKVHVVDIGFPADLCESETLKTELVDRLYARRRLGGTRPSDFHKGDAGHLLLAGGFDSMEGAIIMTARAAFETGAGLATLVTTRKAREIVAGTIPELITRSFDCSPGDDGVFDQEALVREIAGLLTGDRRYDVLVMGPGLGRGPFAGAVFDGFMSALAGAGPRRVLLDGDGLYHLAGFLRGGKLPPRADFVLTPHFSEASRIMDKSVDGIKANRYAAAREIAVMSGAVCVLKGPASIISEGDSTLINTSGNPAMATAGSGDVLSGIVGAMMLRDLTTLEAAGIGAYVHGLAADLCVGESGSGVLKATDIIGFVRRAMQA